MSTLRETLEKARGGCVFVGIEAVRWADGSDKGAVERVCRSLGSVEQFISSALTQLTELERDHEAMEKALETIKMLHANHASILGDRCSMALDMGETATKVILGTQAEETP